MANYDHNLHNTLQGKFPDQEDILGVAQWKEFLASVLDSGGAEWDSVVFERWRDIRDAGLTASPRTCPRIFVSHRQADQAEAERIAYLACTSDFEYWVDVHDPNLTKLSGISHLTAMQLKWLTAGIIEMCTHVISVMTLNTPGSAWVPYDYGRITDLPMHISRAASWLDPKCVMADIPDYMLLGVITWTEKDILNWLIGERHSWFGSRPAKSGCCNWGGRSVPTALS